MERSRTLRLSVLLKIKQGWVPLIACIPHPEAVKTPKSPPAELQFAHTAETRQLYGGKRFRQGASFKLD